MAKKGPGPAGGSNVDWKTLKGARGSASRVPALVKALADGKTQQDREAACFALSQSLYADGAVGPSAAPTVPLLTDVLGSHKEGAHRAAWLIAEALTAGHERVLTDPNAPVGGPIDDVRRAVDDGKAILLAGLTDPDARVRSGAAFALAWAPGLADASRPALRKQLGAETNDSAKTSLLLALGILGHGHSTPDDHGALKSATGSPAVRGAGALARLLFGGQVSPLEGGEDVVALLQSSVDREGTPWCGGRLDRLVVSIATRLHARGEVALAVAAKLDVASPADAWRAPARALLDLGGFTEQWKERDVALPEELSPTQTTIARSLALRDGVDEIGWGIPRSGRDRRRWLGLAAPGPLERQITFEEGRLPLWRVWRMLYERHVSDEPLPGAVAVELDADEKLEALAEVNTNAYGILALTRKGSISSELFASVAEDVGPRAAEWAVRYADEIIPLILAQSAPELGDVIGMKGAVPCYLAILNNGGAIDPRWFPFVPFARVVLEKMPPLQREAAVWQKMNLPHLAAPDSDVIVASLVPLLDLVPSQRIIETLLARIVTSEPDDAAEALAHIEAVRRANE